MHARNISVPPSIVCVCVYSSSWGDGECAVTALWRLENTINHRQLSRAKKTHNDTKMCHCIRILRHADHSEFADNPGLLGVKVFDFYLSRFIQKKSPCHPPTEANRCWLGCLCHKMPVICAQTGVWPAWIDRTWTTSCTGKWSIASPEIQLIASQLHPFFLGLSPTFSFYAIDRFSKRFWSLAIANSISTSTDCNSIRFSSLKSIFLPHSKSRASTSNKTVSTQYQMYKKGALLIEFQSWAEFKDQSTVCKFAFDHLKLIASRFVHLECWWEKKNCINLRVHSSQQSLSVCLNKRAKCVCRCRCRRRRIDYSIVNIQSY